MSDDMSNEEYFEFISKIKESDVLCNCPWMECTNHPGSLCSNKSVYIDECPNPGCKKQHWLGEGSIGEDVHICVACSTAMLKIIKEDVPNVMQKFTKYMPKWMGPLNDLLREAYKDKQDIGWVKPQKDALGVLTFAYIITRFDSKGGDTPKTIPVELLVQLADVKKRLSELIRSFKGIQPKIKEET